MEHIFKCVSRTEESWGREYFLEKRIFLFRKYQKKTWTELYKVFLSFSYPSPDLKIMVTYQ